MDNITTSSDYSNMVVSHQRAITSSLAITWTVASNLWKRYVSYLPIKLNIQKTSSYSEEITNVQV
jgi:hypothetical protein